MARWFLITSELSHLSNEAETFAGIVSTKQTRHHDASPSVLQRYEQNVNKLRDILMVNDPFTVADDVVMNIITKAVMPYPVKNAIIQRNSIGQEMFDKFIQERLVDKEMSIWSPMNKVKLLIWKSTRKVNKCTTSDKLVAMNDDRELFARFLVVILARPELNLQECIGEFEFAVFPRSLFALDGTMRSCAVKSKLMAILESLVVEPPPTDNQPNSIAGQVTIIDGMAVVQAMGKPTWVRTGKDLAKHFLNVVEQKSTGFDEVHVIFDRYDIANSLKENTTVALW